MPIKTRLAKVQDIPSLLAGIEETMLNLKKTLQFQEVNYYKPSVDDCYYDLLYYFDCLKTALPVSLTRGKVVKDSE